MFEHYYPKSDRPAFKDVLFDLFDKKFSDEEEEQHFLNLPEDLKFLAYQWGLSDTEFKDGVWTFYKNK
jgi:hypothetical protein